MFVYLNFTKEGLISNFASNDENKIAQFVFEDLKINVINCKKAYKEHPDPKNLDSCISHMGNPTIAKVQELIKKYDAWSESWSQSIFHDIQNHSVVRDDK